MNDKQQEPTGVEKHDTAIDTRLNAAWEQVDGWSHEKHAPSSAHLNMLLKQQRQIMKYKLWRDLAVLWTLAIILLAGGYLLAERSLNAYLIFQSVLVCVGVGAIVVRSTILPHLRKGK
ncbi:DUF5345 family protein [Paenibacillus marinisediminis]